MNGGSTSDPILVLRDVHKVFKARGRPDVAALSGVSLEVHESEFLGVVGESGSGKSTLGKAIMRLIEPTGGTVEWLSRDITHAKQSELRRMRNAVRMVFQNPFSSLNPRMTLEDIVAEPLKHGPEAGDRRARTAKAREVLERTGLRSEFFGRYPHQLSGGQRQRVAIARAIVTGPRLLVADEAVSALDPSIQASVLNLLLDLHSDYNFACIFITHDLGVVEYLTDRVVVMFAGRVMEQGSTQDIIYRPQHPYSQILVEAAPIADPVLQRARRRVVPTIEAPPITSTSHGCTFAGKCPLTFARCMTEDPELQAVTGEEGHRVACHLYTSGGAVPRVADRVKPTDLSTATAPSPPNS